MVLNDEVSYGNTTAAIGSMVEVSWKCRRFGPFLELVDTAQDAAR